MSNPGDNVIISIVSPVYNVAPYLRECMDSLLGQTLRQIEIICVDDASTDGSLEILREYAARDKRVTVIEHKENLTAAQSRKDGALASHGQYILFVDPDDSLDTGTCRELADMMEKHQTDILHFSADVSAPEDIPVERLESVRKQLVVRNQTFAGDTLIDECFLNGNFGFQLWNKLYRGDYCRAAMREFPDGCFPKAQDLMAMFVLLFFARSYTGIKTRPLYHYKLGIGVTGGNVLTRRQIQAFASHALVVDGLRAFLQKQGSNRFEAALCSMNDRLLWDSLYHCANKTKDEDTAFAWNAMFERWGAERIAGRLACKNDRQEDAWARRFKDVDCLRFTPRKTERIATYYHTLRNGGAQRVVAALINAWVKQGYEVTFFADEAQTPEDYEIPACVERVVLPAHNAPTDAEKRERQRILSAETRARGIDLFVYNAWVSPMLLWDMITVKGAGAAFYVFAHSVFTVPLLLKPIFRFFRTQPEMFALADGVVTLSDTDKRYWQNFNARVFKVYNPLTFPPEERAGRAVGANLLWVGRLANEKRPWDALGILAQVLKTRPDARLIMVGSGTEVMQNSLLTHAKKLGVENAVDFVGFQKDVRPFYRDADVFLCTSKFEGFCLSIFEAQSMGLPTVSYSMPYLSVAESGLGCIFVQQGSKIAAAKATLSLLQDNELYTRISAEARRNIAECYKRDMGEVWDEIIATTENARDDSACDPRQKLVFQTIGEHVAIAVTGVQTETTMDFVPLPKRGPCKMLRKKLCTLLRILLIDGFRGLRNL